MEIDIIQIRFIITIEVMVMTWEEKRILWEKVMGMRTDSGEAGSLFEPGGVCDRLYEQISAAQHRLLDRLGVSESRDMDEILNLEDKICMHVAIHMFEYGMEYTKQRKM